MVEAWAEKTMRTQVARGHYYIREAPWSWQGFNRRFYRWAKQHGGRFVRRDLCGDGMVVVHDERDPPNWYRNKFDKHLYSEEQLFHLQPMAFFTCQRTNSTVFAQANIGTLTLPGECE